MKRTITAAEFEDLYRATVHDLFAYVRRRSGHDAEETVAEVFAVAWRRRDDLPEPAHRRAWLYGVARTLLLAAGRLRQRDSGLVHALSNQPVHEGRSAPADETAEAVAVALERLDPGQQEVLRLIAWECLSSEELAVALGIRPGTARVRLHRARRALASDPGVRALIETRGSTRGPARRPRRKPPLRGPTCSPGTGIRDTGAGCRRGVISCLSGRPGSKSTSAIPSHPGSEAATRTPTGSCARTDPGASTSAP